MTASSMALDVPFLPDGAYIAFLNRNAAHIAACHFSLFAADVADGRYKGRQMPLDRLLEMLGRCRIPRKYLLLNARFNKADCYLGDDYTRTLNARLEKMLTAGVITGVVFADLYLLTALSDSAPAVAAALEAVPSINFMIDSVPKAVAVLDGIAATHFKQPGKLPLDRAVNRTSERLAAIADTLISMYPEFQIELLANEGCIDQCPYKLTHDSLIALLNTGANVDTLAINRDLGCMRRLNQAPWRILASPFIRPEDVHHLAPAAGLIKICGRTLGPGFLMNTIRAYIQGHYNGNLFDLLDACNWMARTIELPNHRLPESYWNLMTTCRKECRTCTVCQEIWKQTARTRPFSIDPME